VASSGAALNGSPLSGSYSGAKRMLWLMALYANDVARKLDLGIHFQAILPQQIIGDTALGRAAGEAYAKGKGVSVEIFFAGFGAPLPPRKVGDHRVDPHRPALRDRRRVWHEGRSRHRLARRLKFCRNQRSQHEE